VNVLVSDMGMPWLPVALASRAEMPKVVTIVDRAGPGAASNSCGEHLVCSSREVVQGRGHWPLEVLSAADAETLTWAEKDMHWLEQRRPALLWLYVGSRRWQKVPMLGRLDNDREGWAASVRGCYRRIAWMVLP
jgi:hypothetical protein